MYVLIIYLFSCMFVYLSVYVFSTDGPLSMSVELMTCIAPLVHMTASTYRLSVQHMFSLPELDRLVGLVVKASASRAGGPGFESR